MGKLFEKKITNDEDLQEAMKELAWQGTHAIIAGKELVIEMSGGEKRPPVQKLEYHAPAYQ